MEELEKRTDEKSESSVKLNKMLAIPEQGNGIVKTKSSQKSIIQGDNPLPVLVRENPVSDEKLKEYWKELRQYFRSGKLTSNLNKISSKQTSALLYPYFNAEILRTDYPLWIADKNGLHKGKYKFTFSDLLSSTLEEYKSSGQNAKILSDNLIRLDKIVIKSCIRSVQPVSFKSVIQNASQELRDKLKLKGDDKEQLEDDLKGLLSLLPHNGVLVPFSPLAPLFLFSIMLERHRDQRNSTVKKELAVILVKLKELIRIENKKRGIKTGGKQAEILSTFADNFIQSENVSKLLPENSSELMSEERFNRIKKLAKSLEKTEGLQFEQSALLIVEKGLEKYLDIKLAEIFPSAKIKYYEGKELVNKAINSFDNIAAVAEDVFSAKRKANLELKGNYKEDVHDYYFENFGWQNFNSEEIASSSPVIVMMKSESFVDQHLSSFAKMASSGRPVKIIVLDSAETLKEKYAHERKVDYSLEPGVFALMHRNTFVLQSAAIHPEFFCDGIKNGLATVNPALFSVLTAARYDNQVFSYIDSGAAVESRIFPEFIYDTESGLTWSKRFKLEMNPQVKQDWSVYPLKIKKEKEKEILNIAFTTADFILSVSGKNVSFADIPDAYCTEDIIPINEYLLLPDEIKYEKIPFVWTRDEKNKLHRVAVPYWVVLICIERMEFWEYLQELGGIKGDYLDTAVSKALEEQKQKYEKEKKEIISECEQKLIVCENETAGAAMDKLTSVLLDIDQWTASSVKSSPTKSVIEQKDTVEEINVEQEQEQEQGQAEEDETEQLISSEAWVDSIRCTSCNDCIDINSAIFQYNADKQATIADASAGPFAHIVQAAENCPAKCIHPGSPLDPNEPHLDELIKRADPLN